jgi:hypothetical protein
LTDEELRVRIQEELKQRLKPLMGRNVVPETLHRVEDLVSEVLREVLVAEGRFVLGADMVSVHAYQSSTDPTDVSFDVFGPPWMMKLLGQAVPEYDQPGIEPLPQYRKTILTLAPKETHGQHQDCPMHLVPLPSGGWMCLDCGCELLMKRLPLVLERAERLEGPKAQDPKPGDVRTQPVRELPSDRYRSRFVEGAINEAFWWEVFENHIIKKVLFGEHGIEGLVLDDGQTVKLVVVNGRATVCIED